MILGEYFAATPANGAWLGVILGAAKATAGISIIEDAIKFNLKPHLLFIFFTFLIDIILYPIIFMVVKTKGYLK